MIPREIYAFVGVILLVIALNALIRYQHLMRKILSLNVLGSGVFLIIGALAQSAPDGEIDPVPQALIITGIVVAVAATALALAIMVRVARAAGRAELEDTDRRSGASGSATP